MPSTVSQPSSAMPYVFNSEFFYRFANNELTPQIADANNTSNIPSISVRKQKPIQLPLPEEGFVQAGSDSGILISQGNNKVSKKSSLVYYGIHTSRVFGYVAANNIATPGSYSQFPTNSKNACAAIGYGMKNGYAKKNVITEILYAMYCPNKQASLVNKPKEVASLPSLSIPDLEPAVDFRSMAIELTTSWVEHKSYIQSDKRCTEEVRIQNQVITSRIEQPHPHTS